MKIALAQLNSIDDIDKNLQMILTLIDEAAAQNAELIVFPENSLYFRVSLGDGVHALEIGSPIWKQLRDIAVQKKINIHLTTAINDTDKKIYNGSVLIRVSGEIEVIYRKVHLFDISLTGQNPIRESDTFSYGSAPSVFSIGDFKFGSSVCYDVRFSELYTTYAKQEVDVILVPAAFLVKTGMAHWEILLRARAIESQCYVLAPAQVGVHQSIRSSDRRETYGHSIAVGPWGDILSVKPADTGLIFVNVNKQAILDVRVQIPMKAHRRLRGD